MVHKSQDDPTLLAAWMYYNENLTQEQIAQKLNVSRVTVTRLLQKAKREGIVEVRVTRRLSPQRHLVRKLQDTFGIDEAVVAPTYDSQDNTLDAVGMARRAGFDNISLDLMYGIPGQPLKRWQANVHMAVGLQVEHLSMYAVMIEPGTPLQRWVERGLVPPVDDDLQADMLDWAEDYLQEAGFRQYEISNWARVDAAGRWRICAHNYQYWQDKPYLGVGAGAHGYTGGIRTENIAGIEEYILSMNTPKSGLAYPQTPATTQAAAIDQRQEMQEFMMMGLRLTEEGIRRDTFAARFGLSLGDAYRIPIQKLVSQGLLEWAGEQKECLHLTKRGKRLGNRVFMEFVGEI